MKKLEFETSKGMFGLVDDPILPQAMSITTKYIKLSEITEEKAREIVDEELDSHLKPCYKSYTLTEIEHVEWEDEFIHYSAIESLHSLLKSKGIHLFENPYTKSTDLNSSFFSMQVDFNKEKQAEEKTFYNPYIFII